MKLTHLISISVINASFLSACQSNDISKVNTITTTIPNVQVQNLSDRDKLRVLMLENSNIDTTLKAIIDEDNGRFLNKISKEYKSCASDNFSVKGFEKMQNYVNDLYIKKLSDAEVKEHVQLLSPFVGDKSIRHISNNIRYHLLVLRDWDNYVQSDEYRFLNKHPNYKEIFENPKYFDFRSVLNYVPLNDSAVSLRATTLRMRIMTECNIPLSSGNLR